MLLGLLAFSVLADSDGYMGSETCKTCHLQAYQQWQGSHHDWAMKPADSEFVLGDFNNAVFEHYGIKTRFFQQQGNYFISTQNAKGEVETFPVAYTFGFYPLQQYLLPMENGRLQALTVAWDSRPKTEGGQRWFHLYPDEPTPHDDVLHWTGTYFNWNSRCAACHSTNLERNYDTKTDTYNTHWSEINVSCEACHGPAKKHLEAVTAGHAQTAPGWGFDYQLSSVGYWLRHDNEDTAALQSKEMPDKSTQLSVCGGCHSRRVLIDKLTTADDFHQKYHLQLLREPLYYADGQIRDEVYVLGSFLQSKMHQKGVVCSNCHNPHSLQLKAPGNGVCAQCHNPQVFDDPKHHHHRPASSGAQCVNCHMPETTYMVVDPRRDHSLRIPRPDLSKTFGTPNACNQCHQDKTTDWANQALQGWLKESGKTHSPHFSEDLLIAFSGSPDAYNKLLALSNSNQLPQYIQASALHALQGQPTQQSLAIASRQLTDSHPLVRAAAVDVFGALPLPQRYAYLEPVINDPNKHVRLAVARQLLGLQQSMLSEKAFTGWSKLRTEYQNTLALHPDTPEGQMNIGLYYQLEGDFPKAEAAYQKALSFSPMNLGAYVNLADLYRQWGQEEKAAEVLEQGIKKLPEAAALHHARGLLLLRQRNYSAAEQELKNAARLDPAEHQYGYVYGLVLQENQKPDAAITEWETLLQNHPGNREVLIALLNINRQRQHWDAALNYATQLQQLEPNDQQLQNLIRQLQAKTNP